jgi:hypothetical protein
MSPIRRVVNLVCALALTLIGGALSVFLLFFAHAWSIGVILAAITFLFAGLCWLWSDFINAIALAAGTREKRHSQREASGGLFLKSRRRLVQMRSDKAIGAR